MEKKNLEAYPGEGPVDNCDPEAFSNTGAVSIPEATSDIGAISHIGAIPRPETTSHTGAVSHTGAISKPETISYTGTISHKGAISNPGAISQPETISYIGTVSHIGDYSHTGIPASWRYLGNGRWAIPTQYVAWMREVRAKEDGTPNLQFEVNYDYEEDHPYGLPDYLESNWHPLPSKLILKFSHAGEWIKIPRAKGDTSGPDYTEYFIGRLERYLDSKGNVRKAVAYGKDSRNLNTWFHFEDVKKALGPWVLPETPYWYNNKKWISKLRKEHVPKKEASSYNNNQGKEKEDPKQGHYIPKRPRDSHRNRNREDRRPERSINRDRGRGNEAAKARLFDYGKSRRS